MNIHYFQHTPSEGIGEIETWVRKRGHNLTSTRFHLGEPVPDVSAFDWLIVMGGPMNVYEHRTYPWLIKEKCCLEKALAYGKTVLGICLGSQLIADVLGGKVFQNPTVEIGWFPVNFSQETATIPAFKDFPKAITPLHWHGDTFSLPIGATNVAASAACQHQAFAVGDRVVGLQFHLEVGIQDVAAFLDAEKLGDGQWIQTPETIYSLASNHLPSAHAALYSLLDAMEGTTA